MVWSLVGVVWLMGEEVVISAVRRGQRRERLGRGYMVGERRV